MEIRIEVKEGDKEKEISWFENFDDYDKAIDYLMACKETKEN